MASLSPARRRFFLRPRAGRAATALLVAGLAGSGALALFGRFVEPATAQTAASRIDQPTPATVAGPERDGAGKVADPLEPKTDVMDTGAVAAGRADPEAHLPDSMRRAH